MRLSIETPIRAYIEEITPEEWSSLRDQLTYTNTAVQHEVKRLYHNHWARDRDEDAWKAKLKELKAQVKNTLVFTGEDGRHYIRPGSIPYLTGIEVRAINKIVYPKPKKIPWANKLPFELYPYQASSVAKLPEVAILQGIPTNVELCTGAGKSAILLWLAREMGLPGAVIAPSKSIFLELVEKFEHHLGRGNVGKFGNGTKKIGKLITVCIADSLCNVQKGTPEWDFFSKLAWMGVDESHTWGADTLEEICHGVLGSVPYRFFCSGTQTRGDGTEKLLQSLIGRTVEVLTTAEAVRKGYICKHKYKIFTVESSNPSFASPDPMEMKRKHFLGNKNIAALYAKIANVMASKGEQTLILVEELGQIQMILPLLKVPYAYAHSETNKVRLEQMKLNKVTPNDEVERFNKNEVKVLVGTSCIATGTNIFPTHWTLNWVGGQSEIKTKQGAVGRSVRLGAANPWAKNCAPKECATICDVRVTDVPSELLDDWLDVRIEYYGESGTTIDHVKLK